LRDVPWSTNPTETYTDNGNGTGTLKIFEGSTLVDSLTFVGFYAQGSFMLTSDNFGATPGTLINFRPGETPSDLQAFFKGLINGHAVEGTTITTLAVTDEGQNVTSSVHYTWQFSTDGGITWAKAPGSSDSGTYTPPDSIEGDQLRVIISFVEPPAEGSVLDVKTILLGTIAEGQVPTLTATETAGTQTNTQFVLVPK